VGWAVSVIHGAVVGVMLLIFRDVKADRRNFKFWALWMIGLYEMPTIKAKLG
jgi:hypothetical protein